MWSGLGIVVATILGGGCGRIGFGPLDSTGGTDGAMDARSESGQPVWGTTIAGSSEIDPLGVAVGPAGELYVLVRVPGEVDFGGGYQITNNGGRANVGVIALDANGQLRWARGFEDTWVPGGGILVVGSEGIAVERTGDPVITGEFVGTIDFGDGPRTSNAGSRDGFAARLAAADGSLRWARTFGGTAAELVFGVATRDDLIVVVAYFSGTVDLGAGPLTSAGGADLLVVRYDLGGGLVRADRYGGAGDETPHGVTMAGALVAVAGTFDGTTDLGNGMMTAVGSADLFVAGYDAAGTAVEVRATGGTGFDIAWGVAFEPVAGAAIAGGFSGTVDFGIGTRTSAGGRDVFIAGIDSGGTQSWIHTYGGSASDDCYGLVMDGAGNVVAAGYFSGTVDFGTGPITSQGDDIFVISYTRAGTLRWVKTFGSSGADRPVRLALAPDGTVVLLGTAAAPIAVDDVTVDGVFLLRLD